MIHKANSVGDSTELPFCFFYIKVEVILMKKSDFLDWKIKFFLTKEDFYRTIKSSENSIN